MNTISMPLRFWDEATLIAVYLIYECLLLFFTVIALVIKYYKYDLTIFFCQFWVWVGSGWVMEGVDLAQ